MTTIWPGCLPVSSIRWRHWRICNVQPILSFFFSGIFLVHSVLAFWFLCEMMLKRVTTRNTALSVYISSIATSSQCLACWFFLPLLHAHVHTKKKKQEERKRVEICIHIYFWFVCFACFFDALGALLSSVTSNNDASSKASVGLSVCILDAGLCRLLQENDLSALPFNTFQQQTLLTILYGAYIDYPATHYGVSQCLGFHQLVSCTFILLLWVRGAGIFPTTHLSVLRRIS